MGLLDEASRMIDLGARVNEGDRKGLTCLMACVRLGVGGGLDGKSAQAMKRQEVDGGGREADSGSVAGGGGESVANEVDADEEKYG